MHVIISRVTTERIQAENVASKLVEGEKWNKKSSLVKPLKKPAGVLLKRMF